MALLAHFREEVARLERQRGACLAEARRLLQPPSTCEEFDEMRGSVRGEPLVMPATWLPRWRDALGAESLSEGLIEMLGDLVEVEVFHMVYGQSHDHCQCGMGAATGTLTSTDVAGQLTDEGDHRINRSFGLARHALDTKHINGESICYSLGEIDPTPHAAKAGVDQASVQQRQHDVTLAGPDSYPPTKHSGRGQASTEVEPRAVVDSAAGEAQEQLCTDFVAGKVCPIPASRSVHMPFGSFVRHGASTNHSSNKELLYLTWRGLPGPVGLARADPEQFQHFVNLFLEPAARPPFIDGVAVRERNLWVGNSVTSQVHFDALDNLHVCLEGRKTLHLSSPWEQPDILFPDKWEEGGLNNQAGVRSGLCPGGSRHAQFRTETRGLRAEVHTGEAVYIPAGWWHEVFTVHEMTWSANIWFPPSTNVSLRPTLLMLNSEMYYNLVKGRH